ncbi:hypothetical protein A2U01_0061209, partial [Trifolium medium]|nr:hypothetical protein [Trifolium medium]
AKLEAEHPGLGLLAKRELAAPRLELVNFLFRFAEAR